MRPNGRYYCFGHNGAERMALERLVTPEWRLPSQRWPKPMPVSAARVLGQRSMVHRGRRVIGHIDATEGCKGCGYGVWHAGRCGVVALSKESGFEKVFSVDE